MSGYTVCLGRVLMGDSDPPSALRVLQRHVVSFAPSIPIARELVKGNGGVGLEEQKDHWFFVPPAEPGTEAMAFWIEENKEHATEAPPEES